MKQQYLKSGLKLFVIIGLLNVGIFAQTELDNRSWGLFEINGRIVKSEAYIRINKFNVIGSAGCNRLFGTAEISGKNIRFSKIAATKMFCAEKGVMKLEMDLSNTLKKVTRYKITRSVLSLYSGNRLVLKFTAGLTDLEEKSFVKLEDKKWILEAIENKSLPEIETEPFINFVKTKGSAGGSTGCNSFGGNYTAKGETIKVFGVISTMRACIEDERMNVEREFNDSLGKANRYKIVSGKLNLYHDKILLLTFRAENK